MLFIAKGQQSRGNASGGGSTACLEAFLLSSLSLWLSLLYSERLPCHQLTEKQQKLFLYKDKSCQVTEE